MKTINNIFKGLLAVSVLAVAVNACESVDYPDRFVQTDGLPKIYGVRYTSGVMIEKAFMDEVVCIMGDNLTSVNELYFNDQKAILNTSFITENTLLVSVPKNMPVVKTNKMYFINAAKDTLSYDFTVLAPVPSLNEMSFEYAEPGETVILKGSYFYEDAEEIKVEFTGASVPHSDIKILNLNEMEVKIPAGATTGRVKVTTESGLAQSKFYYKDNRGLLFDFDGTNGLYTSITGWHPAPIASDGVSGNCLMLDASDQSFSCDGGDWHDAKCHFEYWAGTWAPDVETYGTWDGRKLNSLVDFSDFANMALKFEVKIDADKPWKGCPMQVIFSGIDLVSTGNPGIVDIDGNVLPGCNNTYFNNADISLPRYFWRPWKGVEGGFHTDGKWQTVTMPISEFKYFHNGSLAKGSLTEDSFANLELFLAGGTASEGENSAPIIKIDNIRAVPAR